MTNKNVAVAHGYEYSENLMEAIYEILKRKLDFDSSGLLSVLAE